MKKSAKYFEKKYKREKDKNRALSDENKKLHAELKKYGSDISDGSDERQGVFEKLTHSQKLFSGSAYITYLMRELTSKTLYNIWKKVLFVARQFRVVTLTFRIIAYIVLFIETSAVMIFLFGSLFVLIVPVIICAVGVYIFSLVMRKKDNEQLRAVCEGKTVLVYHPPKGAAFDNNSYFRTMIAGATSDENNIVFVVSPYFFGSKGFGGQIRYIGCREEAERLYILRRYYYFSFKKHVLRSSTGRVFLIF